MTDHAIAHAVPHQRTKDPLDASRHTPVTVAATRGPRPRTTMGRPGSTGP